MVKGIQKSLDLSTGVVTESEIDLIDPETAEQKLNNLRLQRNHLLAECDWTLLPSSPLSVEKQNEYKVYRQELRDITKTYKSPADVKWPTVPSR